MNRINIHGVIGYDVSAREVFAQLAAIPENEEITVSIHSLGGDMFDALAIYNALTARAESVRVTVQGLAASAGSLIAMAGDVIVMPENAFMMIHNPWTVAMGDGEELMDVARLYNTFAETTARIYARRTGLDYEQIVTMQKETTWLTAAEALDHHFCTQVDAPLAATALAVSLPKALAEGCPETIARVLMPAAAPQQPAGQTPNGQTPEEEAAAAEAERAAIEAHDAEIRAHVRAEAQEIAELCCLSGQSGKIPEYLAGNADVTTVRAELIKKAVESQPVGPVGPAAAALENLDDSLRRAAETNLTVRSLLLKNQPEQATHYLKGA